MKLHLFISSWKMSPCLFGFFFPPVRRRTEEAFMCWRSRSVSQLTLCSLNCTCADRLSFLFFLIRSSAFSVFTVISALYTTQEHILGLLARCSYSVIRFLPRTPKLYFEDCNLSFLCFSLLEKFISWSFDSSKFRVRQKGEGNHKKTGQKEM